MPATKRLTLCPLVLLLVFATSPLFAQRFLGDFANLQLQIDTQIESPAVLNNIQTLSEQSVGNTIQIQLFVPEAAGKQTVGYNIEFDMPGKTISEYIGTISGTSWTGAPLTPTQGRPVLTALLISGPTVPSDGYIGQISLDVISAIEAGTILTIKSASMADLTAENDPLNVSSATVTFTGGVPAIPGDFDLDGDVDFGDFLTFAQNFGKSGPVPTSGATATTTITIRDTITITKTDTVIAGNVSPEFLRAELLLGFWAFNVQLSTQTITDDYLMGDIRTDPQDPDGELVVLGADAFGTNVIGGYSASLESYLIFYEGQSVNVFYNFTIVDGSQAIGSAISFLPGDTPDQGQAFEILPTSGRSNGFPAPAPVAGKRTIASLTENPHDEPLPQPILDAYYRLKRIADSQE